MTELFTEQAQFAKANNHVYVNGIHYDEAKAQREIKYACDFEAKRGISFPITDVLFAMWLLRQVYVQQPVEVKEVKEEYVFNGKTKTRTKTYFNGIEYRDFDKAIAASDDFKEQKKLIATLLYAEEYTDRTKGVGSEKGIPYGHVAGDPEILFTPFGYYDIGTDNYYHVEGENIAEFADDETPDDGEVENDNDDETDDDNNEDETNDEIDGTELTNWIISELDNPKRNYVLPEDLDDHDDDEVENDNDDETNDDNNEAELDNTKSPKHFRFTYEFYSSEPTHFHATFEFYSSEGGFNPITNGEHYKECCDLIDKPSWMSQELYDLLE